MFSSKILKIKLYINHIIFFNASLNRIWRHITFLLRHKVGTLQQVRGRVDDARQSGFFVERDGGKIGRRVVQNGFGGHGFKQPGTPLRPSQAKLDYVYYVEMLFE